MSQLDIKKVRLSVDKNIGSKVKIRCNRGRHKIDVTEGVISQTFPSIFIVDVENKLDSSIQKVSYSYTDVLTKDVRLQLM
ncbi:MAG: Veg family protein [Lachnospiraceae bacterium]|nr:Veg family protein [Lachnospiraceae bacterium]